MPGNDHAAAIRRVAREVLAPLGLAQRGRSRLWLADASWRAFFVEFQPSSWSKGTYCNVGVMWLWDLQTSRSPHIAFHVVERLRGHDGEFVSYSPDHAEHFERAVRALAEDAARKVAQLQEKFRSPGDVAQHYSADPSIGWPGFHRGVALGITGRSRDAALSLSAVADDARESEIAWVLEMGRTASELAGIAPDQPAFVAAIEHLIARTREGLRLPARVNPLTA